MEAADAKQPISMKELGLIRRLVNAPPRLLRGTNGEQDSRGNIVTHVAHRQADGTPVLSLVDADKVNSCIAERRCQSCGEPIPRDAWLGLIGPVESVHFREAPIHLECAAYSFSVCPNLLRRTKFREIEIALCKDYGYEISTDPVSGAEGKPKCVPVPSGVMGEGRGGRAELPDFRCHRGVPRVSPEALVTWYASISGSWRRASDPPARS